MYKVKVLDDCIHELSRLPGIGRKTASRLAMHIVKMKPEDAHRLAKSITTYRDNICFCQICGALSEKNTCPICDDSYRDDTLLCVVEDAKDLFIIEQTGYYKGKYHVLGGKISPLDGIGPDNLRIDSLLSRVEQGGILEVIIATNPDVDGETTALYLTKLLKRFSGLKITKLASGIPLGSHIEYADEMTVMRAIEGRRESK